jgi:hypothetical protein
VADKQTKLSIVVRTVDQATVRIKAINDRLDAITKPVRDFKSALSDLREKSGLNGVIDGFKGVGSAIAGVLAKLGMLGGVAAGAVAALFHIADGFDELGDKAEEMGVSVDWLAQTRAAAEKSGASIEQLDSGMKGFAASLGLARAGTGKMAGFLKTVNPELLKQIRAAKGNEEAFDLVADAMENLHDPAKRAAAAQKMFGDASLAPLLVRGSQGIQKLREEYFKSAGSMEEAAKKSGELDDAQKDLKASVDGVKAALISGLAPALTSIVKRLAEWFTAHRADIEAWAKQIGERLPGAIQAVIAWLGKAWDKVTGFVDAIGGLKVVVIALGAALLAGPVFAIGKLIAAMGSAVVKGVELIKTLKDAKAASDASGGAGAGNGTGKAGGGKGGGLNLARASMAMLNPGDLLDGEERSRFESMGDRLAKGESLDTMFARKGPSVMDVVNKAMQASLSPEAKAKITIDISGAPRGTRVKTDPQGTADVETSLGLQMEPAL